MSSEKLVRCEIEHEDGSGRGVRYVPLEMFGLWEHLMARRHGFRIAARSASVWVELEEGVSVAGVRSPVEKVTELCLFVFDPEDGMLHRICRFVPTPELDSVREILVGHFAPAAGDPCPAPWLRERHGVWFRPRAETDPVGAAASSQAR
jgi:hypothetical protein